MWCFNGVNSLMLAAHPALRHLQKDLGVKVEEGMKRGTRNSWWKEMWGSHLDFPVKTIFWSNPRASPLCIQKWNYVITLSHCGFFMPDLKVKSSLLSIVGANWKNVITARGLVYPRLHFPWSFICILNNRIYIKADVSQLFTFMTRRVVK